MINLLIIFSSTDSPSFRTVKSPIHFNLIKAQGDKFSFLSDFQPNVILETQEGFALHSNFPLVITLAQLTVNTLYCSSDCDS